MPHDPNASSLRSSAQQLFRYESQYPSYRLDRYANLAQSKVPKNCFLCTRGQNYLGQCGLLAGNCWLLPSTSLPSCNADYVRAITTHPRFRGGQAHEIETLSRSKPQSAAVRFAVQPVNRKTYQHIRRSLHTLAIRWANVCRHARYCQRVPDSDRKTMDWRCGSLLYFQKCWVQLLAQRPAFHEMCSPLMGHSLSATVEKLKCSISSLCSYSQKLSRP